jgi:hypothetical protein
MAYPWEEQTSLSPIVKTTPGQAPAVPEQAPAAPDKKVEEKAPETPKEAAPAITTQMGKGEAEGLRRAAKIEEEAAALRPGQMAPLPKYTPKDENPLMAFAALASVIAVIGSGRTRGRMTAAMNAAAAAITGFQEGKKEKAEHAYKVWQAETHNAIQEMRFTNDAYKTVLDSARQRETLAIKQGVAIDHQTKAETEALATSMQDPAMALAAKKGLPAMVALQEDRQKKAEALQQQKLMVSAHYDRARAQQELMASPEYQEEDPMSRINMIAENDAKFHVQGSRMRSSVPPMSPKDIQYLAEQVARYEADPPSNAMKLRNPDAAVEIERQAKEINPDWTEAEYALVKKARMDLQSPRSSGGIIRSLTATQQHLEFMESLIARLPGTSDIQTANKITSAIAKEFGLTAVTSFDAAKSVVGAEVANAIVGKGSGTTALQDRKEIREAFETKNTPDQLTDIVNVYKGLIGGQLKALEDQYSFLPEHIRTKYFKPEMTHYYRPEEATKPAFGGPTPGGKTEVETSGKAAAERKEVPSAVAGATAKQKTMRDGKEVTAYWSKATGWRYEDGTPVTGQ